MDASNGLSLARWFQEYIIWIAATSIFTAAVTVIVLYIFNKRHAAVKGDLPPRIPSNVPFIGCAIAFGKDPINFLIKAHAKYGDVFSFTMVGKTFTYLIGSDSSALLFNSRNEDLNAEEVYSRLVTPVFGKGVAYDVPHDIFLEQKKMLKNGLSISHFKQYIPLIEDETIQYFEKWGEKGQQDLFKALSELIILTASSCLHGPEIRELLDGGIVAQLYTDLDGGFSHAAWLLPGWLPLPSFKKRDNARKEMASIFSSVINKRRNDGGDHKDILNFLINTTYKNGRPLTNEEITGLLIGLLMAGQHTSSSTSSWLGFYLAKHQHLQTRAYEEQMEVCGHNLPPLDYDQLKNLSFLDRCLKETLRLRPPIMTLMRQTKTTQTINGFVIPPGHQVCVSPTVNHRLKDSWTEPEAFDPDRFIDVDVSDDKFSYVPFGAGRHRCIGETFAYVQIKTIWSVLLRKYKFELVNDYFPPVNYQTMIHTPTKPMINYKLRK